MKNKIRCGIFLLLLGLTAQISAAPRVVVTIKPIHSWVAALMAPENPPVLLLPGNASPHSFQLRPSDARLLYEADLIIWVGPSLESFLSRPLENLAQKPLIVPLLDTPGLIQYPQRAHQEWHNDEHDDSHGHDHHHHDHHDHKAGAVDPHIWLDPKNAVIVVGYLRGILQQLDPEQAPAYAARAATLIANLEKLDHDLQQRLRPWQKASFFVLHDAFQYLEKRYQLNAVRAMYSAPNNSPSVAQMHALRDSLHAHSVQCVFKEPQLPSAFVAPLIEGFDIQVGTLDPLGANIPAGPDAYAQLMGQVADGFDSCFQKASPAGKH